ncbi:protein of unknown function (plasmid) [Caballeronia sp. S22]
MSFRLIQSYIYFALLYREANDLSHHGISN